MLFCVTSFCVVFLLLLSVYLFILSVTAANWCVFDFYHLLIDLCRFIAISNVCMYGGVDVSMFRGGANITIKSAIRILLRILNNVIYICVWFCICRWCLTSTGVKRESKARTHYLYNVYSNTFYTVIKECRCISFRQKD